MPRTRIFRGLAALAVAATALTVGPAPARAQEAGPPPPTTTEPAPVPAPVPPTAPPAPAPDPAPPAEDGLPEGGESAELDAPETVVVEGPGRAPTPVAPTPRRNGPGAGAVAAARQALAGRLATGMDALALARETEATLAAELAAIDARLVESTGAQAAAIEARDVAAAKADAARADAEEAERRAREHRRRLSEVAVSMFLHPPHEAAVAAALQGELDDRMTARSMLTARAELVRRAVRDASTSAGHALRLAATAASALRAADDAAEVAEQAQAAVRAESDARRAALEDARATMAALTAEVGELAATDAALAARLSIDALTHGGSLRVLVGAGGGFTVDAAGFPGAADLVRIPGTTITVHRAIADQVGALVLEAAAAGVPLDGWGHRDTNRQIQLRRQHCGDSVAAVFEAPASSCRPPTARPGRSMHERGLAVDFKNCSTRSTACYQWLAANAFRFGLFNLPSEPWHWSTNGN